MAGGTWRGKFPCADLSDVRTRNRQSMACLKLLKSSAESFMNDLTCSTKLPSFSYVGVQTIPDKETGKSGVLIGTRLPNSFQHVAFVLVTSFPVTSLQEEKKDTDHAQFDSYEVEDNIITGQNLGQYLNKCDVE